MTPAIACVWKHKFGALCEKGKGRLLLARVSAAANERWPGAAAQRVHGPDRPDLPLADCEADGGAVPVVPMYAGDRPDDSGSMTSRGG